MGPLPLSRRSLLKLLLGAGAWAAWGDLSEAEEPGASLRRRPAEAGLKRTVPRTGERLPAVGLGTARTFDAGSGRQERAPLKEVLRLFVERGGSVVDSSPMYGSAETVVGDLAAELGVHGSLFLATKVWTRGRAEGVRQMEASLRRLRASRIDLIQVHNLLDWRTQLKTLRAWKADGRIRYLGATHYLLSAFDDLERLVRTEGLDFLEIPYSIGNREAEKRLLPAAAEHGTAVIVHTPFEVGGLFRKVRGRSLPPWAAEFDCRSWAQFFLKFILSHPAVTCVIPATAKPKHLEDNMQAGSGRLPDARTRRRMVEYVKQL